MAAARAILRALLRGARAWERAAAERAPPGATPRVVAREPVSLTAWQTSSHGWSVSGDGASVGAMGARRRGAAPTSHGRRAPVPSPSDYHLAAARHAAPTGIPVPPDTGVWGVGGVGRLIMANFRAGAAAAPAAAGPLLDAALAAMRSLAGQTAMEASSSTATTRGVVVDATSAHVAALDARAGAPPTAPARHVWTYRIRVTNANPPGSPDASLQVVSRGWEVKDAAGRPHARVPPGSRGVVGTTPILGPADCFEYFSSTDCGARGGSMEGALGVAVLGGAGGAFDAAVARFALLPPPARGGGGGGGDGDESG